jgi:hypothetical protein
VAVGLAVVLILAIALIRGCSSMLADSRPPQVRGSAVARRSRQVAIQEFRPAPWLVEFDGERLFAAADTEQRQEILASWPVDQLTAYRLGEKQPLWQRTIDADYSEFYLGGNRLLGFKQFLAEPPHLQTETYNADSERRLSFQIDDAGCITLGPQVASATTG